MAKKPKITQASLTSPLQNEMMALIKKAIETGEGPLADIFGGFNKKAFEEGVQEPALKNFRENILPELQEKFIAGNQVGGSGMMRAQNKAAVDLQSQLAALMYQYQQESGKQKQQGLESLLNRQTFENIVQQPADKASIWQKILPALGAAGGAAAGGYFGGAPGAVSGGSAGQKAGEAIAG